MRKMFLDNLPKGGKCVNKNRINWKASIGYKINFIYDEIEGEIEVVDYYKQNNQCYINIKYNNNIYSLPRNDLFQCKLGNILGVYTKKYKYQVGDIITDINSGKLKILKQIRISNSTNKTTKGYKYKCLVCGNEDTITEVQLNSKVGCNVCCFNPQKIKIGYNDMWTTNPTLAKLLADLNDGYKYTQNSGKFVNWRCPICNEIIKNKVIAKINQRGLSCPKCSDKLPYPEKFVFSVMQQLNIDFIYQLTKTTFDWCKNYKYDFYFEVNHEDYILETNGMGHYQEGFSSYGGRTLQEEKSNDRLKKELAINNNIKEDNYIAIDCRYSDMHWIKEYVINSKLNNIFDLSKIDWLKCHEYACSSLVKKACELWCQGICSTIEIGEILKLNKKTIIKYLKQGKLLNWCNYDPKKELIKSGEQSKRKVICLNNKKIFDSIKEANIKIGIKSIYSCCINVTRIAGKDQNTGEYLQWQFYDEYLIKSKKLLSNNEIDKLNNKSCAIIQKKIICLNNNEIFNSIADAGRKYEIDRSSITKCCRKKQKSSGKDPTTKEPLHWMYYEEYLKIK